MKIVRGFAVLIAEFAIASTILAQTPAPVRTQAGLAQGAIENGITVYKGIPFADMKRVPTVCFGLPLFATAVSTAPAQTQDETAAVTRVMNDYVSAFGSFDAQRVLPYYHEPLTVIGLARLFVFSGRSDIETSMLEPVYVRLKEAGWDARSEWTELHVKQMSAVLAVASGLTVRRRSDGQELERVAATYLLRKTSEGWKIAALALHDPGTVLRLD